MLVKCYVLMAKAYLAKGEKENALDYLAESQKLDPGKLDLKQAMNYTKYLLEFYSSLGDYQKALEQSNKLLMLTDSIDMVKMAEKVSLLTESFELEQMEGQLSQKEEQLKKNRMIAFLFIAISALILLLAGIIFFFLRQKQKAARLLEKQNREIEQARARAEQSEKFKEQFLARMSHEIRTPLNAVIGMTGLLLDEPQPPKTENYLKSIKQAGEHLTGIINEILDLSKIDAGKLELYEAPFHMPDLLKDIGNLFQTRAKEKELQLIIEKGDGSPDWFLGDSNRIRQILVNLVGNAVKFTDQGSVQVKMTADDIRENKAMITFSVEDTGPGIPKEAQAKIFEEYVQAGQAGDQKVAGTGLGLSIVRKLVNRMGGTLALESEPGKGSAFSFTVPLTLSSEEAWKALQKEKDLALTAMKGAYRILVVEDNPSNQIVTEGMLEKILPEAKTIIDIGGQDAKIITVAADGRVRDFVMNDKCAAGTGRFLEMTALKLDCTLDGLSLLAEGSNHALDLSSTCVVFAESEIVGLIAANSSPADIARAVHNSIAKRVLTQISALDFEPPVVFTGGVALNRDLARCLSRELATPVSVPSLPLITGALGAAILAVP